MGFDILLNQLFSIEHLKTAFFKVLGIDQTRETIVFLTDYPETTLPDNCVLLVMVYPAKGEMELLVELYFQKGWGASINDLEFTTKLCAEPGCNALISDDKINPYSMIEVTKNGDNHTIYLNDGALDEDAYIVVRNL